jgi:mRNA interferase HigB
MRVIAKRTLREFWQQRGRGDAMQPLRAWFAEASKANWLSPGDVKAKYRSVSIVGGNRAVFNIAGNKYRLVVMIRYQKGIVFIRFIGTHQEYDRIDVERV